MFPCLTAASRLQAAVSGRFLGPRIDLLELRIDDVIVGRPTTAGRSRFSARATGSLRGRAVQRFAYPGRRLLQALRRLLDCLRVLRRQTLPQFGDGLLDLLL